MDIQRALEVFPGDTIYEVFDLDCDTGELYWNISRQRIRKGNRAGWLHPDGYRYVAYKGHIFKEHQIIFRMTNGYWSEFGIDHVNGRRDDNRPENLREVSKICNSQNCKIQKNNKSGIPGVYWDKQKNKWRAYIQINKKRIHLGYYENLKDAALARWKAELHLNFGECNSRAETYKAIKRLFPDIDLDSIEADDEFIERFFNK